MLSAEFLDFLLEPELVLLQLGDAEFIEGGMVKFTLNLAFEGLMPIVKFGDMRL